LSQQQLKIPFMPGLPANQVVLATIRNRSVVLHLELMKKEKLSLEQHNEA